MALEWIVDGLVEFFKTENPKNILRQSQRRIESHRKGIDKQDMQLAQKENDLMNKLRTLASDSNAHHMLKLVATDIYRLRKNRRTLQTSKNNLSNMENRIIAAQSTQIISESFRTTTIAMAQIANDVNPKSSQNMIRHFEKFNEDMSAFTEMIDEATEDASLVSGEREGEMDDGPDTMVNMILSEAGIEIDNKFPTVSSAKPHVNQSHEALTSHSELDDLSVRLSNLRNP